MDDRDINNIHLKMNSYDQQQQRQQRTLILCFDGTSNEYDAENTNVVKLFALLKKDDFTEQMCYYQSGVGTYYSPGVVSPLFQWSAKILDEAFAWYLDDHVMEGYRFVMQNYRSGDKICLFGFSRGAYTARALGGFLFKIGLLPKDNQTQVPFAYKLYKRTDDAGLKLCAGFKQTYCQDVRIEFMGVWDTVTSVGVIMSRTLPFTNSNKAIKTFRHAISLDEHRVKFRPNHYHRPSPNNAGAAYDPEHASPVVTPAPTSNFGNQLTSPSVEQVIRAEAGMKTPVTADGPTTNTNGHGNGNGMPANGHGNGVNGVVKASGKKDKKIRGKGREILKRRVSVRNIESLSQIDNEVKDSDVMEVWFAGCHGDVGGGYVLNDTRLTLSDISLRWMVREIVAADCGIQFDPFALARARIDLTDKYTPMAKSQDMGDARQTLHDQLAHKPLWWILEALPLTYSYQDKDGVWHKQFGFHLGRGRNIIDEHPKFHSSVRERMQNKNLKYTPRATWKKGTEVYVD